MFLHPENQYLHHIINGQGFYDTDGNLVFSETDCGRTGLVLFKFIVKDEDGLTDQVIDIPIEITN